MEATEGSLQVNGELDSPALRGLLAQVLDEPEGAIRPAGQERLNARVHRLRFEGEGGPRSVVVKRMGLPVAHRNALVLKRWLPAAGLSRIGPVLLGEAPLPAGGEVWHAYQDHGEWGLESGEHDAERVEAAASAIAELHVRFAGHPLLGECRLWGGDLGIHFHVSSVQDAIHALAALDPPAAAVADEDGLLRDRLLARLRHLLKDAPRRARLLEDHGGPETLLHGDLWTKNVFVAPGPQGFEARLIDWDHAAVGRVSYDLSTFLYRFPVERRAWVLEAYRRAVSGRGPSLPSPEIWNELCETAELARIANRLIWPAIGILDGGHWGWEALREVERWFEALAPVLP